MTFKGQIPWNKGKTGVYSEEARRKMSEAMKGNTHCKGRKLSDETKRKLSEAKKGKKNPNYGKHLTEEHRRKISEAKKGHEGWKHTPESKRKLSEAHKGKIISEETRRKLSEAGKGRKHTEATRRKISESHKGEKNPQYGKHLTEDQKRKLSEAHKGEKSHWWKGGWKEYYGPSWRPQRRKALNRDGHMCKNCKKFETNGKEPQVHHIIRFNDFGVERHLEANNLSNLITLCDKCHKKIENNPDGIKLCRGLIPS